MHDFIHEAFAEIRDTVTHIEPVVGQGECNGVFFVSTERGERVLRTNGSEWALLGFEKEAWCLQATAGMIPGPEVVALGRVQERAYMIETRVMGRLATDIAAEERQARGGIGVEEMRIWRRLGEYARRLEAVAVEGFGFYLKDGQPGVFETDWPSMIDYYDGDIFQDDLMVELQAVTPAQRGRIRARFAEMRQAVFPPRLTHANFALKNTIVGEDGTISVIDWGTAEAHRGPHMDIAEVATGHDPLIVNAFIEGCGFPGGLDDPTYAEISYDVDTLIVLRALDALRWAHRWGHAGLAGFVATARGHVGRIVGGG